MLPRQARWRRVLLDGPNLGRLPFLLDPRLLGKEVHRHRRRHITRLFNRQLPLALRLHLLEGKVLNCRWTGRLDQLLHLGSVLDGIVLRPLVEVAMRGGHVGEGKTAHFNGVALEVDGGLFGEVFDGDGGGGVEAQVGGDGGFVGHETDFGVGGGWRLELDLLGLRGRGGGHRRRGRGGSGSGSGGNALDAELVDARHALGHGRSGSGGGRGGKRGNLAVRIRLLVLGGRPSRLFRFVFAAHGLLRNRLFLSRHRHGHILHRHGLHHRLLLGHHGLHRDNLRHHLLHKIHLLLLLLGHHQRLLAGSLEECQEIGIAALAFAVVVGRLAPFICFGVGGAGT
mmetsp:Transcript_18441/g.30068  ORF Transcript_18441/g.30068 Transcript_18441/m.30068 type:complete len:340 (-) Transcript_18441:113-1132(-)